MEDLRDLKIRKAVAEAVIKKIEDIDDDPRKESALNHYKAQLASIEERIAILTKNSNAVVIGLKPADLSAKTKK